MKFLFFFTCLLAALVMPAGLLSQPAANIRIKATATGRPTQHVVDYTCENTGSQAAEIQIGPYVIYPPNGKQPLYVKATIVTIPAGQTISIPGYGVCLDKNVPPANAGYDLGSSGSWYSFENTTPLSVLASISNVPGIATFPATAANLTYPGTPTPFPYRIDYSLNPGLYAWYILEAEKAFESTYPGWSTTNNYTSFFEKTASGNSAVMDQQVFTWIVTSHLQGKQYQLSDLQMQFASVVAEQQGTKPKKLSESDQNEIKTNAYQVWSDIHLVGIEAKVLCNPTTK